MGSTASRQDSETDSMVAHVAPLFCFVLLSFLVGAFKVENSALPWYQSAPQHWGYPLQIVVIGLLLIYFRREYVLRPWRGFDLAAVCAVVGIAIWIAPGVAYERMYVQGADPPGWWSWLGIVARREGFDPTIFGTGSWGYWLTIVLRFARSVVIVPLVEELFWRGFLMRYVQGGEKPFTSVAFGTHTWLAFWITTVAVTLIHEPEDYLAAFVWGALVYFVAVRTRSLGACVVMHGVGNLLLGMHVLNTQMWGYW